MQKPILTADEAKRARQSLGLSQREVAAEVGTNRSKISSLESGRFMPEADFLHDLRAFYAREDAELDTPDEPHDDADPVSEAERERIDAELAERVAQNPMPEGVRQAPPARSEREPRANGVMLVSRKLAKPQVDALMDALDTHEAAVMDLAAAGIEGGASKPLFADGVALEDEAKEQQDELRRRVAAVAVIRQALQGKTPLPLMTGGMVSKPWRSSTHGELMAAQMDLAGLILDAAEPDARDALAEALGVAEGTTAPAPETEDADA